MSDVPTDYTDPTTIDVDEVVAEITHQHRIRGHTWGPQPTWPKVTVLALANEVVALREHLAAAAALLEDARPRLLDPSLRRSWGQRRRLLLDAIARASP